MSAALVTVYISRAEQLARAAKLTQGDSAYTSALALTSVHSAIAYNDAVLTHLTGSPHSGEDHKEAVRKLRKACRSRRVDSAGITHLDYLISRKTEVSYSRRLTTREQADVLFVKAERFQAWAEGLLPSVTVTEAQDDRPS